MMCHDGKFYISFFLIAKNHRKYKETVNVRIFSCVHWLLHGML